VNASFRFLEPGEGQILSDAIRAAYGDTYDLAWVYDSERVSARLADGTYISCVAETPGGELLCHAGLSRTHRDDAVGHSGQAVTTPAARGHHLFTQTKQHLMDRAHREGMAGMYSEATAAHPYSQRANVQLGAMETGFLLGWIPASVDNDAADAGAASGRRRRQSAALFYSKLADGRDRPVHAPTRHRAIVERTIHACRLRGSPCEPEPGAEAPERTRFDLELHPDHGLAVLTVHEPGADLEPALAAERHHHFHHGLDAIYFDLPLDHPATALTSGHLERLGVSYAGIFPNSRADGDVIRFQSLHRVRISADDVAVASEHGQEILDYVLADLPQA